MDSFEQKDLFYNYLYLPHSRTCSMYKYGKDIAYCRFNKSFTDFEVFSYKPGTKDLLLEFAEKVKENLKNEVV